MLKTIEGIIRKEKKEKFLKFLKVKCGLNYYGDPIWKITDRIKSGKNEDFVLGRYNYPYE